MDHEVIVYTTVWQRPLITNFHFHWMKQFKEDCLKLGVKIIPFYVLSDDDKCLELFIKQLQRLGHTYIRLPRNQRLSEKSQQGLRYLRATAEFDYLMHLDSDEILSMGLMERWLDEFEQRTLWFGSSSCYFYDVEKQQAWEFTGYSDHPVKNGGTCLHYSLLQTVDWKLWPIQRNQGLNVMERRQVEKFGYQIKPIDTKDYCGVVELKGGENAIHGLDWFHRRNLLKSFPVGVLQAHHPQLALLN